MSCCVLGRPAGTTIFPPAFNWWMSGGGMRSGAAVTITLIGPGTVFLPALAMIEQQHCSMLDWTPVANGALLVRPEAP